MQPVAGATGKRFDELGGRRLQTRLGGAKLRLGRAGRNGSNLRLDALEIQYGGSETKKHSSGKPRRLSQCPQVQFPAAYISPAQFNAAM